MATITLKINERSKAGKAGKALKDLIDALAGKPQTGVEIVDEKSPYNPEFVKKIKKAEKEKGAVMKNASSLWESL